MGKRTNRPTRLSDPRLYPSWIGVGLFWLVGQLPWNFLLATGRGLGHLAWRLAKRRSHIARTNIRLCFPELTPEEQENLARRSVVSTGEAILEMAGSFSNHRIDLDKRLVIKGMEHIEQARADGKGVLLLGMHFNSIDVGSRLLGYLMDFYAVYRPNDNRVIDRLINQGRGNYLKGNVPRSDIRQMIRLLRNGEVLWYAPDQDYGIAHAVFVPFFGIPAATITATSRIARMGKARVIPTAHYRLPGGRYQIEFGPPLENFPSGDDEADTARINQTIEHYVRKHPEQYLWVHKRFKHQPDGAHIYR
ncbi:MAG: lipid A biosynthesis acyltransferase [Alcanivorax sp.]|uniref:LpxL/LpxP family Kdo(2)-lipid IV(A) lauroyl/palmitoleoyl acyltransferase n=2 Tax=Alcanivorax TaxID=59753 RepID=UPI000789D655|nr:MULTISPECIES: LpxL/LpxP family Kdo(2)-lipid IV(A) lauroyl/palmitoleoyl acyltransferase [unclassified Alcanivorax]MBB11206.1 lipid A biosynthesis acyltransferase [Alcanivorax sp.]MBU85552.1 lipid A biosynthesis acyltransferase [Alcanivorax sp.]MEE2603114.1 LpxL/LpxP family Kdo(2)-lipid IV(A) lauroyl/palmitoleoyl acyltransferase [Pseudomonadota bacterium]